jgi:DNA polymerase-3 subunit beta
LSLSATNLDIAITQYIGAKVENEGSITVPARLMQEFISSLPSGVINLELDETKLKISTDQYHSTVNGIMADDFPVMPAITTGKTIKLDGKQLKRGLQQVVFAASNDESRPVLTGVLIHNVEGRLYLAATDSYRLAEKEIGSTKEDVNLLVPATALNDLLRVLGDDVEQVTLTYDEQQVLFNVGGDVELVARLLEGKYPDYRKLIPEKFEVTVVLKKADLVNVTKVSSLFARESAGSVTIKVDEPAQELSIRSIASQLGENTATATGKVTGSGEITLNSRYLLDALQAFTSEELTFGFNGKLDPTCLSDAKNADYTHIIMPLKS